MSTVTIAVLGPFEVRLDGRLVNVPPGAPRTVLAALALHAPNPAASETLEDLLSDARSAGGGATDLEGHVRQLRAVLGDDRIRTETGGWRLEVEPAQVDAIRFTQLVTTASKTPGLAGQLLAEALDLWRGEPFAGVDSPPLRRTYGPALADERLLAVERLADHDLASGKPDASLRHLRELGSRHPTREPLWARLISALVASDRVTEALVGYHQVRQRLAETFGAEPGPDLHRVHRHILDRADSPGRARPPTSPAPPFVPPDRLPPSPSGFIGRGAELSALNDLVSGADIAPAGAQAICTIHGPGGAGKTALALEWAHRIAERFPDGQIYLNLRGYGLDAPADPGAAMVSLLRATGLPTAAIPTDPVTQVATLRDRLSGRRILILLDNVRDADQVRPLLPGARGVVLVTSRSPLAGLRARDGARQLELGGLAIADARKLLAHKLSPARLVSEPDAVARIHDRCHGLPLAVRVVAERASSEPASLGRLADDIAGTRPPDQPGSRDPAAGLRAVLSWAIGRLDEPTAAAVRRLGIHPGTEVTPESMGTLVGSSAAVARATLDRLTTAQLIEPCGRRRYRVPAVVKEYAAGIVPSDHPAGAVEAVARVVDWYLHTVANAHETLGEPSDVVVEDPDAATAALSFRTTSDVAAWFDVERETLAATVRAATEHELYRSGYQLAYLLRPLFHWRLRCEEFVQIAELGVECARRVDDEALARALRTLGVAYAWASRTEDATTSLLEAVAYAERTGDLARVAIAISGLGVDAGRTGDYPAALRHHQQAIDVSRRSGDSRLVGSTLLNLGFTQIEANDCDHGIATSQEALDLFIQAGAELEAAWAMGNLAQGFRRTLRPDDAIGLAERALPTLRRREDVDTTVEVLVTLGRAHHDLGHTAEAQSAWREAATVAPPEHELVATIATLLDGPERLRPSPTP